VNTEVDTNETESQVDEDAPEFTVRFALRVKGHMHAEEAKAKAIEVLNSYKWQYNEVAIESVYRPSTKPKDWAEEHPDEEWEEPKTYCSVILDEIWVRRDNEAPF
jgi:hypothetical protein